MALRHAYQHLLSVSVLTPDRYLSMCARPPGTDTDKWRPRSNQSARYRLDRLVELGYATGRVGLRGTEYRVDTGHPDYHPSEATRDLVPPGERTDVTTLSVRALIIAQTKIYNEEYARLQELPADALPRERKARINLLIDISDSILRLCRAEAQINPGADFGAVDLDIPGLTVAPAGEDGALVVEDRAARQARLELLTAHGDAD
jgi:hypothetical protein